MDCPVCKVPLTMSERQGIEIDYCPQCRGVWLDRGELDKILERSAQAEVAARPAAPPASQVPPSPQPGYGAPSGYPQHYGKPHKHHKHKHWLSELFD